MANREGRRAPDKRPSRMGYITRSEVNAKRQAKARVRWLETRRAHRGLIASHVFQAIQPSMLFVDALGADAKTWPVWKLRRYAMRHGVFPTTVTRIAKSLAGMRPLV